MRLNEIHLRQDPVNTSPQWLVNKRSSSNILCLQVSPSVFGVMVEEQSGSGLLRAQLERTA